MVYWPHIWRHYGNKSSNTACCCYARWACRVGPRAALAKTVTYNGCIQAKEGDVLLIKAGDDSLVEVNAVRRNLGKTDQDKSLEPGNCWAFDLELDGQPVVVFVGQATYAGDVSDIGDIESDKPEKQKEDKKERG